MNPYNTHQNGTDQDKPPYENSELSWYAQRPYDQASWNADLHYFSSGNERTHEFLLRMLFEGGFDTVLDAIGTHFNLDSIAIQGVGFLGLSHYEEGDSFTMTLRTREVKHSTFCCQFIQ